MTTKPSPTQAGVAMSRDDAALLRLKKLEDMAECGTVDNWMKLTDDQKSMWFALCVDESSRRKAAENELESLRAAAPPPSVVPFQLACRVRELVGIIDGRGHTQISETVCEEALALIADTSAAALRAQGAGEPVLWIRTKDGKLDDGEDCIFDDKGLAEENAECYNDGYPEGENPYGIAPLYAHPVSQPPPAGEK